MNRTSLAAPLRFLTVLLLVSTGIAGCLSDGGGGEDPTTGSFDPALLSAKEFDILPVEEVWVESAQDGKRIHNAVYRPDTEEPVPVWINFSPYWGDSATAEGDNFAKYLIHEYVPRGYAVVLSAVRGTGHSEGCFQIGGDLELQDAYDVVDHFASAAWSNGNVGTGGKSYDSTTQNGMIAKYPHPALKTSFHVSGITDMYRYNYREGVPYSSGAIFNTYYYGQTWHEYGLPLPLGGGSPGGASTHEDEDAESLARAVDDAACVEFPFMQVNGGGSAVSGMKTDYWIERDWNRYIADTSWNGSIFFYHGLQDWNVKPDHILPWLEELPDQIAVKGWLHQKTENNGHVYPMRADWNLTMLRWMDHHLKGIDTGIMADPAFEVEGSDGVWRQSDAWPPTDVAWTDVPLGDREVQSDAAARVQTVTLLQATANATGNGTLRYAGAPTVTVTVTPQSEDPVLSAVMYKEDAEGERTWTNEAVLRAVYRGGLEAPEPVTIGEEITVEMSFYPQDDVLAPGESWVLAFGEAPRYPLVARGETATDGSPDPGDAFYQVETAVVHLPMADITPQDVQPTPMGCFAC